MQVTENQSLINYHTFHLPVKTRYWVHYQSEEELRTLLQQPLLKENKYLHIGAGSNLLFTQDYDGVVLHSGIQSIEICQETDDAVWLRVGSGVVWDDLCQYAVDHALYGIENLSYIPGEVGASAVQNIGAYGVEVADVIDKVEAIEVATGEKHVFAAAECAYGYRTSRFKTEWKGKYIITAVVYKLSKEPVFHLSYGHLQARFAEDEVITLAGVRREIIAVRQSKLPDPDVYGNAGSFFVNPVIDESHFQQLVNDYPTMPHYRLSDEAVKVPAAWLIEQCGWKGVSRGGAAVHDKQCLVLINKNDATAADIVALATSICESVAQRFAITITPEVNYID